MGEVNGPEGERIGRWRVRKPDRFALSHRGEGKGEGGGGRWLRRARRAHATTPLIRGTIARAMHPPATPSPPPLPRLHPRPRLRGEDGQRRSARGRRRRRAGGVRVHQRVGQPGDPGAAVRPRQRAAHAGGHRRRGAGLGVPRLAPEQAVPLRHQPHPGPRDRPRHQPAGRDLATDQRRDGGGRQRGHPPVGPPERQVGGGRLFWQRPHLDPPDRGRRQRGRGGGPAGHRPAGPPRHAGRGRKVRGRPLPRRQRDPSVRDRRRHRQARPP